MILDPRLCLGCFVLTVLTHQMCSTLGLARLYTLQFVLILREDMKVLNASYKNITNITASACAACCLRLRMSTPQLMSPATRRNPPDTLKQTL